MTGEVNAGVTFLCYTLRQDISAASALMSYRVATGLKSVIVSI